MRPMLTAAAFVLLATPALADRIDGDWCDATGRHVKIDGPTIEIPSGAVIQGEYDRHGFRYVGPTGDPEAGVEVVMQLFSEEEIGVIRRVDGKNAPTETWRRCQATS
ncbi:MAG: hypothetical protein IPL47_04765 [Phyllobacteriaceae bacterium]|nr:hypothetical protein [Phyllobacteriaceae bacterium]